jgi:hypothetical protein
MAIRVHPRLNAPNRRRKPIMPVQPEGTDVLFSQSELDAFIRQQITRAHHMATIMDVNVLLNVPVEDQVNSIAEYLQACPANIAGAISR